MRMIAGSILILAAAVLGSACWLGQVMHRSTVAGSSESIYLPLAAGILTAVGGVLTVAGLFADRESPDSFRKKEQD